MMLIFMEREMRTVIIMNAFCTVLYCGVLYCTVVYCPWISWCGVVWCGGRRILFFRLGRGSADILLCILFFEILARYQHFIKSNRSNPVITSQLSSVLH